MRICKRLGKKSRGDLMLALSKLDPKEVLGFRRRLREGKVVGRFDIAPGHMTTQEPCGCLIGTVAIMRGAVEEIGLRPNPIVQEVARELRGSAFMASWEGPLCDVDIGDTPETNEVARQFDEAIEEFIASNPEAFREAEACGS